MALLVSCLSLFVTLFFLPKCLAGRLSPTDTITWGGDNSRQGYSTTHNLDPTVVASTRFGQLFKTVLPGDYNGWREQIYSQPLVYTLDDGIQYVFVATTQNNIYKIDAKTGDIVANRTLHIPFLTSDLDGCVDINPTIGVTSTGVIDASTDTWYITAKTYLDQSEKVKGRTNARYYLHAIDVNTLNDWTNFPVDLEGILNRNSNPGNRMFEAGAALQRPGLLHYKQYVYAGFASHCVQYNFTGWVIGWDKQTGRVVEALATEGGPEPNTMPGGGVWMSGGGISGDDMGSMFLATGNGYASQLEDISVPGRQPPTALEEAALHLSIADDGSLTVVDFFIPWEKVLLDGGDKDLGTTPLQLLDSQVYSCPMAKRLGIVTGKTGKTYLLDLDNLGGYQMGPSHSDAVIQVIQHENSVYAAAGVFPPAKLIYINVTGRKTKVYKLGCADNGNPIFSDLGESEDSNAQILGTGHGTVSSLSGQAETGLLWTSDVQGENLRVYNALPVNGKLKKIRFFNVPGVTKFSRPVFGNGIVYLATTEGTLYAFGASSSLPLICSLSTPFAPTLIDNASGAIPINCEAVVDVSITSVVIPAEEFLFERWQSLPLRLQKGEEFSFLAIFAPKHIGDVRREVKINVVEVSTSLLDTVEIPLRGTGISMAPVLNLNPAFLTLDVEFTGRGAIVNSSITIENLGDSTPLEDPMGPIFDTPSRRYGCTAEVYKKWLSGRTFPTRILAKLDQGKRQSHVRCKIQS
jgi:outer membrane protein assembly factor BamB